MSLTSDVGMSLYAHSTISNEQQRGMMYARTVSVIRSIDQGRNVNSSDSGLYKDSAFLLKNTLSMEEGRRASVHSLDRRSLAACPRHRQVGGIWISNEGLVSLYDALIA